MRARCLVAVCLGLSAMQGHCADGEEGEATREDGEEGEATREDGSHEHRLDINRIVQLILKIDANKDGKLSMQEVLDCDRAVSKVVAASDTKLLYETETSQDGQLSLLTLDKHLSDISSESEQEQAERKQLEAAKFKVADLNGDGFVDWTELPALLYPEAFDHVMRVVVEDALRKKDADGDGSLTKEEFLAELADDPEMPDDVDQDFAKLDKNGDGRLDVEELLVWESGRFETEKAMTAFFEMADKDGDMHLTAGEIAAGEECLLKSEGHQLFKDWSEHEEL